MIAKKASKIIIEKIKPITTATKIISYIPIKRAIKVFVINNKLMSSLNLSVGDYYLDKNYKETIDNCKGNLNSAFENAYVIFQKDIVSPQAFAELASSIMKYLKYLYYVKKEFKTLKLEINGNTYMNWFYLHFAMETFKCFEYGLSLKVSPNLNYKYYNLIKDAIHGLKELKSIIIHSFKNGGNRKYTQDYFEFFDWTKVKVLNFSDCLNYNFIFNGQLDFIPENASFTKLYIDEEKFIKFNKLFAFLHTHGSHIYHVKCFNFSDISFYNRGCEFKLDADYFEPMCNLVNLKLISCKHLLLFSFVILFRYNLHTLRKLILDGVNESDIESSIFTKQNNEIIKYLNNLKNLVRFEINFNSVFKMKNIFKILSIIINSNSGLKELKISIPIEKKDDDDTNSNNSKNNENKENEKENGEKENSNTNNNENSNEQNNDQNMMDFESLNLKINMSQDDDDEDDEFIEFSNLINAISTLKKLVILKLVIPMNDRMTEIFNNSFNIGESLTYLEFIHNGNINLAQLFKNHPNLTDINFKLICEEGDIKVENEKDENNKISDFKYEIPERSWKNIILNYYPINNSLLNTLIKCKSTLKQFKLNQSINASDKSNEEVSKILLEVRNCINEK